MSNGCSMVCFQWIYSVVISGVKSFAPKEGGRSRPAACRGDARLREDLFITITIELVSTGIAVFFVIVMITIISTTISATTSATISTGPRCGRVSGRASATPGTPPGRRLADSGYECRQRPARQWHRGKGVLEPNPGNIGTNIGLKMPNSHKQYKEDDPHSRLNSNVACTVSNKLLQASCSSTKDLALDRGGEEAERDRWTGGQVDWAQGKDGQVRSLVADNWGRH